MSRLLIIATALLTLVLLSSSSAQRGRKHPPKPKPSPSPTATVTPTPTVTPTATPTPSQPPAAPIILSGSNVTANSFTANWANSSGATGYRLDVGITGNFGEYLHQDIDVGQVTSYELRELSDRNYYYRVRAYNQAGSSGNSQQTRVILASGPPGIPIATAATDVDVDEFTAHWNASEDAIGYRVDIAHDPQFTNFARSPVWVILYQNLDAGIALFTRPVGLNSNATFYYRVRAYNDVGTSASSNVVTVTTFSSATVPGPTNLVATPVSGTQVNLSWADHSGTGFKIELCQDTGTSSSLSSLVEFDWYHPSTMAAMAMNCNFSQLQTVSGSSYLVDHLVPSSIYAFRVRAFNETGNSNYSNIANAMTLDSPASSGDEVTPGAPRLFGEQVGTNLKRVRIMYLVPSDKVENPVITEALYNGLRHLQQWFQTQMGGKTFTIAPIEVYNVPHPSSWYSTWVGRTYSYYVGALHDSSWANNGLIRFNDPDNRWIVYVDANQPCDGANGGTQGLSVMTGMDLLGIAGILQLDMCSNTLISLSPMSRIGGLGHELGHGFNLPHPAGCHSPEPLPCDNEALMMHGHLNYPHAYLRQDEKDLLNDSPFFQVENIH